MFIDVKPGCKFKYGQRVVEIDAAINAAVVSARDQVTGEQLTILIAELEPLDNLPRSAMPLRVIPAHHWDEAKRLRELLEPYIKQYRVPQKTLEKVAIKCGRSVRHVRRKLAVLRLAPFVSAVAPKQVGRKKNGWSLKPDVEKVISHCLRKYYLTREAWPISEVTERARQMCRWLKIPAPSRGSIERRASALDHVEALTRRKGAKVSRQQYKSRTGSLKATGPLKYIQMDHTKVDVHVVTPDRYRIWLGRPWLTVAIDVFTRCVLGIYLSLDQPSAVAVGMCMSHVLLPKESWLRSLGLDVPWPMYGRPERLCTDNGADFLGSALMRGCDEFGIILEHRPVGSPHWGGHVERLIGTLMGRVHLLPGTTFSSIKDREDYESQKKACMTLSELQNWLVYEICCNYHVKTHRGIGMSPATAWNTAFMSSENTALEVN